VRYGAGGEVRRDEQRVERREEEGQRRQLSCPEKGVGNHGYESGCTECGEDSATAVASDTKNIRGGENTEKKLAAGFHRPPGYNSSQRDAGLDEPGAFRWDRWGLFANPMRRLAEGHTYIRNPNFRIGFMPEFQA
jgi:hypothetical protein